ncbi:MAG: DUF2169 domain-containing protein [Deltaproteobacteria bacterium]|nr:DUF2169 domain-containing protein [Deltaproteobacteria bacterium]
MPLSQLLPHPTAGAAFFEPLPGDRTRFTFFAKLTYQLQAGTATLAAYQEPLYAEEQRWEPRRPERIDRAADLRPARPRVDVVLIAPATGFPSLPARFVLGAIDRSHPARSSSPRSVATSTIGAASSEPAPFGPLDVRVDSLEAAAPSDQQLDALAPGEALYLENILASASTFTTALPVHDVKALVSSSGAAAGTVALRPSLVTIDADRGTCAVTFRGELEHGAWTTSVYLSLAERDAAPLALEPRLLERWDLLVETMPPDSSTVASRREGGGARASEEVTSSIDLDRLRPLTPAVPFGSQGRGEEASKRSPFVDLASLRAELERSGRTSGTLAPNADTARLERSSRDARPSLDDRPDPVRELGAGTVEGLGLSQRPLSALLRQRVGPGTASASDVPVVGESEDAADDEARAEAPEPAIPLELLWFDPSLNSRLRKHEAWSRRMPPPPERPAPKRGQPPPPPPSRNETEAAERADAMAVLSRAEERPLVLEPEATRTAADGSGALLQLVSGKLALPFDEVALLEATHAAATPLAKNDKGLRDLLEVASSLLENPLAGAPELALSMVQQIRESWRAANRALPPDYLVAHVERVLLGERRHQRRKLLGDEMLRGWFMSRSLEDGLPAYLPAHLDKRLPLFPELRVRAIVEVLPKQDVYEGRALAIRIVALGRVLDDA